MRKYRIQGNGAGYKIQHLFWGWFWINSEDYWYNTLADAREAVTSLKATDIINSAKWRTVWP